MNILLTGGAQGADELFAKYAIAAGHRVDNLSFEGHRKIKYGNTVILTEQELAEAQPHLQMANAVLKRTVPSDQNNHTYKLLARNYYQIKTSKWVYAVAPIQDNKVLGGTAWAVEMAKQNNIRTHVFDLFRNKWYHWSKFGWFETPQKMIHDGIYTGIGSRNLTREGEQAIIDLYTGE